MLLLKTQKYNNKIINYMKKNNGNGSIIIDSIVADSKSKIKNAKVTEKKECSTTINLQFKQYLEIGGASFLGGFLASLLANWIM